MSISGMSDAKLMREQPAHRPATGFERALGLQELVERPQPAASQGVTAPTVPPTLVGQLVRWIPTESITLYVAFIGLLEPVAAPEGTEPCKVQGAFDGRAIAMVIFTLLTVLIVVLVHIAKVRRTREPFRWPVWEMTAATLAFVAWAVALPDTPLQAWCGYKVEIGAFVVLFATVFIALLADALGRNVVPAEATE